MLYIEHSIATAQCITLLEKQMQSASHIFLNKNILICYRAGRGSGADWIWGVLTDGKITDGKILANQMHMIIMLRQFLWEQSVV